MKDPAKTTSKLKVPAGQAGRLLYPFTAKATQDNATMGVEGRARVGAQSGTTPQQLTDAVRRNFRVVQEGIPITKSHSDLLTGKTDYTVELPRDWVKGTLD